MALGGGSVAGSESAPLRRSSRHPAALRNYKRQPRAVCLGELVEGRGIEFVSAFRPLSATRAPFDTIRL